MLAFFRRALSSWLAVGLLGLIMIAFIVTGVGTPGGGLTGGPGADAVATVAGKPIPVNTIANRAQSALTQARQQQPALTMPQFLTAVGGLGPIVEQTIGGAVLSAWADRHGLVASERLIGGEIGSIPAFKGVTGKFDEGAMNAVLSQRRMTFAMLHDDIRDDLLRRQLLTPITTGVRAPDGVLRSYAQLVIDKREGVIGLVPATPAGIAAPTEAEIADFYKGHIARYSLPERRALRYALIGPETVAAAAAPSEAEIAAQYKTDAAKYAASETRTIQRVVLPDEAAARAFSAKVARGTPFATAATEAGLAAADISVGAVTKAAFAGTDGGAIADAAFALPTGGTTAPVKSALGWSIAHVEAVKVTPARSLAQARAEIAAALAKTKAETALSTVVQQAEDALNDGASFDEVAAKHKLQAVTTPALLPNGVAPSDPAFKADANVAALLKAAQETTADDEATVETIDPTHFALMRVASVVPAAPLPLAQLKPRVAQELIAQRAASRARGIAQGLLAKLNSQPAAAAFAGAGLKPPQPIAISQLELSRAGANVPAPLRVLFRLAPGKAELVQGPNGSWFVVKLERITPGDPRALPLVIGATRNELQRSIGEEYAEQFAKAARGEVTVKRNPAALNALEQQLRGGGQ